MSNPSRRPTAAIISTSVSLTVLALTGWVVLNHQYVFDQVSAWQYQPSAQIATIADRAGMSTNGRFYFYASQPTVEPAGQFNQNCQRQEASSAILACYTGSRIYIYDVTNPQLDGIEEVSAAHETLHAIWDRMNPTEQAAVGAQLEAEYLKLDNYDLKARMAYYDRNEPGQHDNELHSILGTEFPALGAQLEAHYAQYFNNRAQLVGLHASYQQLFDSIQTQSKALLAELNSLAAELTADIASYNDSASKLSSASADLKNSLSSVDRTSAAQVNTYMANRQALLDRIAQLDALRSTINTKTDIYNTKLAEYNKLIVRSDQLQQSIDSSLAPAPTPPSL